MAFAETSAVEQVQPARGLILLVDDEPELRRMLRRALMRTGFEVVDAANGRLAMELLGRYAFEAVVSDVRMPDMDGVELLARVHAEAPLVPVVLMSGSCGLENAAALRDCGAFAFLDKPVQLETLRRAASDAIEAHRERRRDGETQIRESGVQRVSRHVEP